MDKGYDIYEFVAALKQRGIEPHIARHTEGRRSAIDESDPSSDGYAMSQRAHKRIEQGLGWVNNIGGLRKLALVGLATVHGWVTGNFAAYNLTSPQWPRSVVESVTDLREGMPASQEMGEIGRAIKTVIRASGYLRIGKPPMISASYRWRLLRRFLNG